MSLLVTGGTGFIGSHTCVELLNAGEDIVVMDNFYSSRPETLDGIRKITGKDLKFYEADLLDMPAIDRIFDENDIEQVIHFAGYKCVSESVKKPLVYYSNNLRGTFNILETMKKYGCTKFVFSSSADVYSASEQSPLREDCALKPNNPYASTKLVIENLCREMYAADNKWTVVILRYFNVAGAHESGLIGEEPVKYPRSILSEVLAKAIGAVDAPKVDGEFSVSDYIHVADLARGHVAAVKKARELQNGCRAYNLGTGKSVSDSELLSVFQRVNGIDLGISAAENPAGSVRYLDPSLAEKELGWKALLGIEEMCRDAWNYRKNEN